MIWVRENLNVSPAVSESTPVIDPAELELMGERLFVVHPVDGGGACLFNSLSGAATHAMSLGHQFLDIDYPPPSRPISVKPHSLRAACVGRAWTERGENNVNLGGLTPEIYVRVEYVGLKAPLRDPAWNDRYLQENPEGCGLLRGQIIYSFQQYITAMSSRTAYGDEVMLAMAADVLRARIVVFEERENLSGLLQVNLDILPNPQDSQEAANSPAPTVTLFLVKDGLHFNWAHLDEDVCKHRDCARMATYPMPGIWYRKHSGARGPFPP